VSGLACRPLEATVLCGAALQACSCVLPHGHEAATHECDCGGSWVLDEAGKPLPLTLPFRAGAYPYGISAARDQEAHSYAAAFDRLLAGFWPGMFRGSR